MSDNEMEAHLLLAGWKIGELDGTSYYSFISPDGRHRYIDIYQIGLCNAWAFAMEAGK